MLNRRELLRRLGPDAQAGRVFADKLWKPGLDRRIALFEGVIFRVRQDRRILGKIVQIMRRNLIGQPGQFLSGLGGIEIGYGNLVHGPRLAEAVSNMKPQSP